MADNEGSFSSEQEAFVIELVRKELRENVDLKNVGDSLDAMTQNMESMVKVVTEIAKTLEQRLPHTKRETAE